MTSVAKPGGEARLAIGAGVSAYLIWGFLALLFQLARGLGLTSWEILAHRTLWAVPAALVFVLMAGQGREALAILRRPRTLAALGLSAIVIAINWGLFIWAVNQGRVLETSLGYYINPLLNMAAGAILFREQVDRLGWIAVGLATIGVVIQALALGHLPVVSLVLALAFCTYGVVRKRVSAEAQTGLLVECLILGVPSLAYVLWLQHTGQGHGFASPLTLAAVIACGFITAGALVLFSWATRRAPLSAMGFMMFLTPTISFFIGVLQGEAFTPLRALSFVFIWGGVAVFVADVLRRSRAAARCVAESETP
jgi:chloramphenicol-sensitive protein RarD